MTLEKQIGQLLVCGWQDCAAGDAVAVNDQAALLVDELGVGGVILMGRNIESPDQLRSTLGQMQSRAAQRGLPPLFVSIDQEGGGTATRMTPPHFRATRTARQIGVSGDPECARQSARDIGLELREVGINWNYAPVLDVDSNPANPVIGERSYGADPTMVARMGAAAVRGYQDDAGIMACGKHFPGHGDTDVDSHSALPHVAHPIEHLERVELAPFCSAIGAGLAAVMTSHIVFGALDPDLPATLSPKILTGLLRRKMEFDGVIVTDCVEMKGVADGWGEVESAILAVIAGADIILCCHTWETQRAVRDGLVAAVRSGRILMSRIDDAASRVAQAKARWVRG